MGAPTNAAALRSSSPTALSAYVPDGLTPEQFKALRAKEAKAKADNKKRNWGVGRTGQEVSLTEFQRKRDLKYPNTPGAGHMWAKAKYYSYNDSRSRSGTDAAVKQRNDESRAGLFGGGAKKNAAPA